MRLQIIVVIDISGEQKQKPISNASQITFCWKLKIYDNWDILFFAAEKVKRNAVSDAGDDGSWQLEI